MLQECFRIYVRGDHILVKFEDNFDYHMIRDVMLRESQMPEAHSMNDIWLIGKHHAFITLTDLDRILEDVRCLFPENATALKSALVIEPGLTEAMAQLWLKYSEGRVPFTCRIFHMLEEAEEWVRCVPAVSSQNHPSTG